jgi:pimeloyl-ACP methyl ester carboxylesterase
VSQGFRRREIYRAGVRLSYLDNDAAGPVVVMLHGLAGTGDEFTATGGLVPAFDADVMEAIMMGVAEPQWARWRSVTMAVTVVFGPDGIVSSEEQAEFVAARPGTRHVVLRSGSHDAHLDAAAEWAEVLRGALADATGS